MWRLKNEGVTSPHFSIYSVSEQFDDTNWAFLADTEKQKELKVRGMNPDEIADICTQIINGALAGRPADMIITTHLCRGNHASSWLFSGDYEPIAKQLIATHYDGFFSSMIAIAPVTLHHYATGQTKAENSYSVSSQQNLPS